MKLRLPVRRTRADATDATPSESELAEQLLKASGKGRPTPKRNVAQGRRPGPPPPPPATRKEAYKRMREQQAVRRVETKQAAARGDDSYLPPRDRGPERKLVRDVVDSRRNIGSLFLAIAGVALIGTVVPIVVVQSYATFLLFTYFLLLVVDSFVLGRRIRTFLKQQFPELTKTKSLVWYGVSRATMIRRWRFPKPEVQVGAEI